MNTVALENLIIRAPAIEDLEKVVNLVNDSSMYDEGRRETNIDEVRHDWAAPDFDLESDAILVCTPDKQVVGVMYVMSLSPYVRIFTRGRVHPEYRGRGIGTYLIHFAEERARHRIPKAPPNARVTLSIGANRKNEAALELYRREGFTLVRYFSTMEIDLTEAPSLPQWPEGITVRNYIPGQDDHALYEADEDAFQDHWGFVPTTFEDWMHFYVPGEGIDPSLWFLAMDGDQIAGMAECNENMSEDPLMGWVDGLGVRRPWRKRGLGLALLQHAFGEFYRRGKNRVCLGVDTQSLTGATRLYEKAGMHIARQYARYNKELRPGTEISTLNISLSSNTA